MIKVLHITSGLETGGAEVMLAKLVTHLDRSRFEPVVVSMMDDGPILGQQIRNESIELFELGSSRRTPSPFLLLKLAACIKREKPDIVQTWMYHANVAGSLANALAGRYPVVWSIHNAEYDPAFYKFRTRQVIALNERMAHRFPSIIAFSSEASRAAHVKRSYPAKILRTVTNGIDIQEFKPDPVAYRTVREEMGFQPNAPVIGMVARFARQKDHVTFFRAAGIIHRTRPDVRFLLCGLGVTNDNAVLRTAIEEAGVQKAVVLLGHYTESTARLTAAFDVATSSSSFGESFCVSLGEAMSCGVPCVTTAMAGPAALVGDAGIVTPIADPAAMARAWETMLDLSPPDRQALASKARARICGEFSLTAMVRNFEALYESLVAP